MSVSVLADRTVSSTGEGPHWEEKSQSLLYVDISTRVVHKFNTETGQDNAVKLDEDVSFIIPRQKGGYVLAQGRKIAFFDWDTEKITGQLCEVDSGTRNRFNDAKCDVTGRLWAGTMGYESAPAVPEREMGSLYSIDGDHKLSKHVDKIDISNGLAWNKDNSIMYYIDSIPRKVYAFDFDLQQGTLSNQRVAVDFGSDDTMQRLGYPDGMCIDQEDKIWVACYAGAKIVRFDPETGKELRVVDIPALRTTSCCFGGKNYDELYVTCGALGADEEEFKKYPKTGSVFKVTGLGVKGAPAPEFAG